MSTCSHRASSSPLGSIGGGGGNNGHNRKIKKNRIGCERFADEDVEFSEVTEKIFLNINAVFEKDDLLDEFDIISEENQSNHSPVFHIEHKLALEAWCVPFLYQHSLQHFITTIIKPNNEKLKAKRHSTTSNSSMFSNGNAMSLMDTSLSPPISHSSNNREVVLDLNPTCRSCSKEINTYSSNQSKPPPQLTEVERTKRGHELTRVLLLINPDLTTAWNYRREVFLNKRKYFEIRLASELNLISLICSKKPKCLEAFNYRMWLIRELLNPCNTDIDNSFFRTHPVDFFQNEVKFVERAAIKYFSNYHAWTYRSYLLSTFINTLPLIPEHKEMILDMELNLANNWLQTHVSDHSGLHYRQQLLLEIRNHYERKNNMLAIKKLYTDELNENSRMIIFYNGHEALWYHRRAILKQFLTWLNLYFQNQKQHQTFEVSSNTCSSELNELNEFVNNIYLSEKHLVECVRNEIATILKNSPSCGSKNVTKHSSHQHQQHSSINMNNLFDQTKDLKQLNLLYAQRHSKWCHYCFNWTELIEI